MPDNGLHGVYSFRPDELKQKLLQAGLVNIELLYAKKRWMIMKGEKKVEDL